MAVFVSYSRRDKKAVKSLVQALQDAREQVWMDQQLLGGDEWWRTILDQIRGCEVFIVGLSRHYDESKPCQAELKYARDLGRPILPVQIGRIKNMQLNPLGDLQVIDFRDPTLKTGIELAVAVRQAREQLQPLPSPLPDEPPVPFGYLAGSAAILAGPDRLAPEEQSALITRLKLGFREAGSDDKVRRDIVGLLRKLRGHPDVTEQIRTDVDAFLTSIGYAPKPMRWWRRKIVASAATIVLLLANIAGALAYITTITPPLQPVAVTALDKLLLTSAQINTAMAASQMVVTQTSDTMSHITNREVSKDCLALHDPAEDMVYANRRSFGVLQQTLAEPGGNAGHYAKQAVVHFLSGRDAANFYTFAAQTWPLCAQVLTHWPSPNDPGGSGPEGPATSATTVYTWLTGDVQDTDGTITVSATQEGAGGWTCQRALTVSNNIAIDILTCSYNAKDPAAGNIAHQIADKVAQQ